MPLTVCDGESKVVPAPDSEDRNKSTIGLRRQDDVGFVCDCVGDLARLIFCGGHFDDGSNGGPCDTTLACNIEKHYVGFPLDRRSLERCVAEIGILFSDGFHFISDFLDVVADLV